MGDAFEVPFKFAGEDDVDSPALAFGVAQLIRSWCIKQKQVQMNDKESVNALIGYIHDTVEEGEREGEEREEDGSKEKDIQMVNSGTFDSDFLAVLDRTPKETLEELGESLESLKQEPELQSNEDLLWVGIIALVLLANRNWEVLSDYVPAVVEKVVSKEEIYACLQLLASRAFTNLMAKPDQPAAKHPRLMDAAENVD